LQNKINGAFGNKKTKTSNFSKEITNPLQLLKLKFASGDLSKEDFEEKYLLLESLDKSGVF